MTTEEMAEREISRLNDTIERLQSQVRELRTENDIMRAVLEEHGIKIRGLSR